MKRRIDGTAYNTKTARPVAVLAGEPITCAVLIEADPEPNVYPDTVVRTTTTLYRTKTDRFFLYNVSDCWRNNLPLERRFAGIQPITDGEAQDWLLKNPNATTLGESKVMWPVHT